LSTAVFISLLGTVVLLLVLLMLLARTSHRGYRSLDIDVESLEEPGRRHPTYFPLIRQAMSPADFGFLAERGSEKLVRRAHKERQRIALLYLAELRADFDRLLRLARVIAILSPEVEAAQEFERLRLGLQFFWHYQVVLWALRLGLLLLPQLCGLSVMVSQLACRMEAAMSELGERANVAAELASSLDRRGLDVA
jgi:hypothetical protein